MNRCDDTRHTSPPVPPTKLLLASIWSTAENFSWRAYYFTFTFTLLVGLTLLAESRISSWTSSRSGIVNRCVYNISETDAKAQHITWNISVFMPRARAWPEALCFTSRAKYFLSLRKKTADASMPRTDEIITF